MLVCSVLWVDACHGCGHKSGRMGGAWCGAAVRCVSYLSDAVVLGSAPPWWRPRGSERRAWFLKILCNMYPSFVDVALDLRNAFNSVARGAFLPIVASHFPEMVPWVNSMYAEPTHLFVGGKPDKPSTLFTCEGNPSGLPPRSPAFRSSVAPSPMCAREAGR